MVFATSESRIIMPSRTVPRGVQTVAVCALGVSDTRTRTSLKILPDMAFTPSDKKFKGHCLVQCGDHLCCSQGEQWFLTRDQAQS